MPQTESSSGNFKRNLVFLIIAALFLIVIAVAVRSFLPTPRHNSKPSRKEKPVANVPARKSEGSSPQSTISRVRHRKHGNRISHDAERFSLIFDDSRLTDGERAQLVYLLDAVTPPRFEITSNRSSYVVERYNITPSTSPLTFAALTAVSERSPYDSTVKALGIPTPPNGESFRTVPLPVHYAMPATGPSSGFRIEHSP